jgi:hypothetical protein
MRFGDCDVIGPRGQSVEAGGRRVIKAQLALVREQKDGRRGQLVGHLSDVEHRVRGEHRAGLEVCDALSPRPNDIAFHSDGTGTPGLIGVDRGPQRGVAASRPSVVRVALLVGSGADSAGGQPDDSHRQPPGRDHPLIFSTAARQAPM